MNQDNEGEERNVRDARPHRARTRALACVSALGWLLCSLVGVGIYMNVITDPSAVRERAANVARSHAGCGEGCRVLEMQERRNILGYRADYEIAGVGSVRVSCWRTAIVVGDHECDAR